MKTINFEEFAKEGRKLIGVRYLFGAEVKPGEDASKIVAIDCSELTQWLYCKFGVPMEDGARYQFKLNTVQLNEGEKPCPGDLGFYANITKTSSDNPHGICHVGILISKSEILEARGNPFNKVMISRRSVWEASKSFKCWRKVKDVQFTWPNGISIRGGWEG